MLLTEIMDRRRQSKQPKTITIDVHAVKKLLKDCPKEVKNYVRALEDALEVKERIVKKAITKIKELRK